MAQTKKSRKTLTETPVGTAPADIPAAATDGGANPGMEAGEAGARWSWRDFLKYGAVAVILFWGGGLVFDTGAGCLRDWREFREWKNQRYDRGEPDGGDYGDDTPVPASDLAKWIRANLPADGVKDYPAVANVFETVAGELRDGSLSGPRSACAETIALLQPKVSRRVWTGFFTGLYRVAVKDAGTTNAELAELWERIAKAIKAEIAYNAAIRLAEGVCGDFDKLVEEASKRATGADTRKISGGSAETEAPEAVEADEAVKTEGAEAAEAPAESAAEKENASAGDCPAGNCPANRTGYGYGWNYGNWYWPYYGGYGYGGGR